EQYGGVVPELASRAHIQNIVPVVDAALSTAKCQLSTIDAFAFTQSPGLIGSLLVGSQFAKSLALALGKPLIAVHHMQAHVLANLIDDPRPNFPFLCLTVSGGHTQIVSCESPTKMKVIGETIDDAAGEAFDKSAKLLGLPYPGGPLIDSYAQRGNPKKAAIETGIKDVCIAGGVSANSALRKAFEELGKKNHWNTFIPAFEYCTDNAAMIAMTAYYKYLEKDFADLSVTVSARAKHE